jgi:hypothetical protein
VVVDDDALVLGDEERALENRQFQDGIGDELPGDGVSEFLAGGELELR